MQLPNASYALNPFGRVTGQVSLGDSLGATLDDVLATNPIQTPLNIIDLHRARRIPSEAPRSGQGGGRRFQGDDEEEVPTLSEQDQLSRLAEAGLDGQIDTFPGETRAGLDLRIKWRQDELARQSILAAAPDGVIATLAQVGASAFASMLDPIAMGASLVPFVGPARYANALASARGAIGRLRVRARFGTDEEAAQTAVVEPIKLYGANIRQADYDLYDSLSNMVAGSVLGGGLHGAGGAVKDALFQQAKVDLDAVTPEERVSVMHMAASALASGEKPTVAEPLVQVALSRRPRDRMAAPAIRGGDGLNPDTVMLPNNAQPIVTRIANEAGQPASFKIRGDAERAAKALRRDGEAVYVRAVDKDDYAVEIDLGDGGFVRNDAADIVTFRDRGAASESLRRLKRDGVVEDGAVLRAGDDYVITRETNPTRLAALRAATDDLAPPTRLNKTRTRGGDPKQAMSDAIRAPQRLFEAENARAKAAAVETIHAQAVSLKRAPSANGPHDIGTGAPNLQSTAGQGFGSSGKRSRDGAVDETAALLDEVQRLGEDLAGALSDDLDARAEFEIAAWETEQVMTWRSAMHAAAACLVAIV